MGFEFCGFGDVFAISGMFDEACYLDGDGFRCFIADDFASKFSAIVSTCVHGEGGMIVDFAKFSRGR